MTAASWLDMRSMVLFPFLLLLLPSFGLRFIGDVALRVSWGFGEVYVNERKDFSTKQHRKCIATLFISFFYFTDRV